MKIDQIQEIIRMFESSTIASMELEHNDFKIKLDKASSNAPIAPMMVAPQSMPISQPVDAPVVAEPVEEKEDTSGTWIKSPIVGTYYASRSLGSKPFIELGQQVKKGDVLCIIEAMKVMNEIHSPSDGVIRSILVTNESMVEFDQDLIRIG